jgi:hypothetical protein
MGDSRHIAKNSVTQKIKTYRKKGKGLDSKKRELFSLKPVLLFKQHPIRMPQGEAGNKRLIRGHGSRLYLMVKIRLFQNK